MQKHNTNLFKTQDPLQAALLLRILYILAFMFYVHILKKCEITKLQTNFDLKCNMSSLKTGRDPKTAKYYNLIIYNAKL